MSAIYVLVTVVTKFRLGQSAGNNLYLFLYFIKIEEAALPGGEKSCSSRIGTSETTREGTEENIKYIPRHVPKHIKPANDEQFAHYLAGLIDGDGNFSYRHFTLVFNSSDASLAYYIKERLGFGYVNKIRNKNAITYVISNKVGIEKVINLVNGKLRIPFKIDCIQKYLLNAYSTPLNIKTDLSINLSVDLDNYWLAGFSDADASFQIKILNRKRLSGNAITEIRLNFQVDKKTKDLLELIAKKLGGNIGYRSSLPSPSGMQGPDTYYYGSTSFGSARSVIKYFDKYPMLSTKHLNYLKWRKAYLLILDRKHLTVEGKMEIERLKSSMNKYLDPSVEVY